MDLLSDYYLDLIIKLTIMGGIPVTLALLIGLAQRWDKQRAERKQQGR